MRILLGASRSPARWKEALGESIAAGGYHGIAARRNVSELVADLEDWRGRLRVIGVPAMTAAFALPVTEDNSECNMTVRYR